MEAFTMENNCALAKFLTENIEKENIISEVSKLFNMDCLARCQFDPSVLDSLINNFNENDECDISLLEEIITFIKSEHKEIQNKKNELLQAIKKYIDETFTQDISIEKIAEDLHISYFYMCHIFKDNFNMPINTYRTQKRLENAMRLIIKSDNKISDIALSSGYNNISYFTETFTKNIGISPTVFREKNKDL